MKMNVRKGCNYIYDESSDKSFEAKLNILLVFTVAADTPLLPGKKTKRSKPEIFYFLPSQRKLEHNPPQQMRA